MIGAVAMNINQRSCLETILGASMQQAKKGSYNKIFLQLPPIPDKSRVYDPNSAKLAS